LFHLYFSFVSLCLFCFTLFLFIYLLTHALSHTLSLSLTHTLSHTLFLFFFDTQRGLSNFPQGDFNPRSKQGMKKEPDEGKSPPMCTLLCVRVCVCERERERESVCVCEEHITIFIGCPNLAIIVLKVDKKIKVNRYLQDQNYLSTIKSFLKCYLLIWFL